ncbi:MAG: glycogen synthase [bacterium]
MKIAIITNEYPPNIYGGAGVHVQYLTQELAALEEKKHAIRILCFGDQKEHFENKIVKGIQSPIDIPLQDPRHKRLMDTLLRDIVMTESLPEADIVHAHTWYTHFAGCLIKQLLGIPLVLSTHSLEPHRPWKEEQMGSAYKVSTWIERNAYKIADGVVAVSQAMKRDVHELYHVPVEKIRIIPNGIDLDRYKPSPDRATLATYEIDPDQPFILFVGRITRQKGIIHLVRAIRHLHPGVQVVLCAGAPDTEEIGREMAEKVEDARSQTGNRVIWIPQVLPVDQVINLYTHASIFVCPSVYEPFGIINLEAMACETPVVASSVGGIPEVVVHGETGLLVPLESRGPGDWEPKDPDKFSQDLALAINSLLSSPEKRELMGHKARTRVEKYFSWKSVARQTLEFYQDLIMGKKAE